jgi:hypothetical protein
VSGGNGAPESVFPFAALFCFVLSAIAMAGPDDKPDGCTITISGKNRIYCFRDENSKNSILAELLDKSDLTKQQTNDKQMQGFVAGGKCSCSIWMRDTTGIGSAISGWYCAGGNGCF